MTLAAVKPKSIVVGVSDSGHRVSIDHPNHNPKITPVVENTATVVLAE